MATNCFAHSIIRPEAVNGEEECTITRATPRTAGGSSRRRFCRIYPDRNRWMLRVDPSGWEMSAVIKSFATLNAAIAYALAHDFSYRVFHLSGGETQWMPASAHGAPWRSGSTDRVVT